MAVPANFPIFASLPTGLNPLSLFDTAFGMILNGSAPVPIASIAIGTTTVGGGTNGQVLYNNNGLVGNTNQPVLNLASSTGLPVSTGISGLGAGIATFLATPTSANLAAALTDETGSGAAVFANSPALAGVPTAPTAAAATNTTQIATTAFVQGGYLPLPGGTLTGNLTIGKAAPTIALNANAGANFRIVEGATSGSVRWTAVFGDNTAESGGNAGSNFSIGAYDDTGAAIDSPLSIIRAAGGAATFSRPLIATQFNTTNATGGAKGADTINATTYYKGGSYGVLALGTSVTASGTAVDFASVPSGAKRVVIMWSGVSGNGTASLTVQIGNGSPETTGYVSSGSGQVNGASPGVGSSTSGFTCNLSTASRAINGMMVLQLLEASSNTWVEYHAAGDSTTPETFVGGGTKALAGALTFVRVTWSNGTDVFDAGKINISWE